MQKLRWSAILAASLLLPTLLHAQAPQTNAPASSAIPGEVHGLICISDSAFPAPAGTTAVAVPGGDFESGSLAGGWEGQKGKVVTADDAPQGKSYYQTEAVTGSSLRTAPISAEAGKPYFFSMWLKSPAIHWGAITFSSGERLLPFTAEPLDIPGTGNKWKHVGFYAWMPASATTIQFHIVPRNEPGQSGEFINVDDIQLRTATEAEMASAYEAQQAQYPPYGVDPGPGDGSNLALSVAKWEGKAGLPGKPFVIWAIGSSWTEAQKNGYGMIYAIRKRFPNAPPIVYRMHDGAGTPWDYAAGWVKQFVGAEQPDLIFTYTPGTPEGLDTLLTEIRKRTTADIIVPSIHFNVTASMDQNDIENGYTSWAKAREICAKHHAEFVEHRRDLVPYMKANNIKADDLLWDHVHQNLWGRILVWDDVEKHITDAKQFTYSPDALERGISVNPPAATKTETVTLTGNWTQADGSVKSSAAGDHIKVRFTGNRLDVIGNKVAGGGTVKVLIDGVSGDEAPAFAANYIKAKPKVYPKKNVGGQPGDVGPQGVDLGKNLVPQTWTITMTDDVGNYDVVGSITGDDGIGNVAQLFTSKSGQISIEPKDWRNGVLKNKDGTPTQPPQFGNVAGDMFTFDVVRSATGQVGFAGDKAEVFSMPLAENLANQEHTAEIITNGDGPVEIKGLYVFTPMEK